jgi:hypothetical protein
MVGRTGSTGVDTASHARRSALGTRECGGDDRDYTTARRPVMMRTSMTITAATSSR